MEEAEGLLDRRRGQSDGEASKYSSTPRQRWYMPGTFPEKRIENKQRKGPFPPFGGTSFYFLSTNQRLEGYSYPCFRWKRQWVHQ